MAQSSPIGYLKPPQWLKAPYTSFYKANKQPILQANSLFLQFLVAPQISKFEAGKMIQKWTILGLILARPPPTGFIGVLLGYPQMGPSLTFN